MHDKNFLELKPYCHLLDAPVVLPEDCLNCGKCQAAIEAQKPEAVKSNSTDWLCPEGCKLVAVLDGCGESAEWTLYVQDKDGNDIGILAWPDCFGERADENDLIASGFECRRA